MARPIKFKKQPGKAYYLKVVKVRNEAEELVQEVEQQVGRSHTSYKWAVSTLRHLNDYVKHLLANKDWIGIEELSDEVFNQYIRLVGTYEIEAPDYEGYSEDEIVDEMYRREEEHIKQKRLESILKKENMPSEIFFGSRYERQELEQKGIYPNLDKANQLHLRYDNKGE